jgi:hypothetical protein
MKSGYSSHAKRSKRLELKVAKKLGGKRQPASGALRDAKDDIIWKDFRIEQKFTDADSYRLTEDVFGATYNRARDRGQTGFVLVIFPKTNKHLAVLDISQAACYFGKIEYTRPETVPTTLSVKPTTDGPHSFGNKVVYDVFIVDLDTFKERVDECYND